MVSEREKINREPPQRHVLILVLVEDGLGENEKVRINRCQAVLILVLVEDGLGG